MQECYDRDSLRVRSEVGVDLPIPPPRKRQRLPNEASLIARTWRTLCLLVDKACHAHQFGLSWCVHPRVAEDPRFFPAAAELFRGCDLVLFGNNINVAWGAEGILEEKECEEEEDDEQEEE